MCCKLKSANILAKQYPKKRMIDPGTVPRVRLDEAILPLKAVGVWPTDWKKLLLSKTMHDIDAANLSSPQSTFMTTYSNASNGKSQLRGRHVERRDECCGGKSKRKVSDSYTDLLDNIVCPLFATGVDGFATLTASWSTSMRASCNAWTQSPRLTRSA